MWKRSKYHSLLQQPCHREEHAGQINTDQRANQRFARQFKAGTHVSISNADTDTESTVPSWDTTVRLYPLHSLIRAPPAAPSHRIASHHIHATPCEHWHLQQFKPINLPRLDKVDRLDSSTFDSSEISTYTQASTRHNTTLHYAHITTHTTPIVISLWNIHETQAIFI